MEEREGLRKEEGRIGMRYIRKLKSLTYIKHFAQYERKVQNVSDFSDASPDKVGI